MATTGSLPAVDATVTEPGNKSTPMRVNVERRCENPECDVVKMVSMVPKRKVSQFITDSTVMEKPMLINGFTTVFQVDGTTAKLSDIKVGENNHNNDTSSTKTVFRIVPNTHAHITNYVLVDADGETLRKINENDPGTMRKLLESQKASADQMLKRLMAGHTKNTGVFSSSSKSTNNSAGVTASSPTTEPIVTPSIPSVQPVIITDSGGVRLAAQAAIIGTKPTGSSIASQSPALSNPTALSSTSKAHMLQIIAHQNATTGPISTGPNNTTTGTTIRRPTSSGSTTPLQMPFRTHPNLKINVVGSVDAAGNLLPSKNHQPLASAKPAEPSDKGDIDKMKTELEQLRRTVFQLAQAQAKSQVQIIQTQADIYAGNVPKRMRPN